MSPSPNNARSRRYRWRTGPTSVKRLLASIRAKASPTPSVMSRESRSSQARRGHRRRAVFSQAARQGPAPPERARARGPSSQPRDRQIDASPSSADPHRLGPPTAGCLWLVQDMSSRCWSSRAEPGTSRSSPMLRSVLLAGHPSTGRDSLAEGQVLLLYADGAIEETRRCRGGEHGALGRGLGEWGPGARGTVRSRRSHVAAGSTRRRGIADAQARSLKSARTRP